MGRKVIPFEEGDNDSPIRLRLVPCGDNVEVYEVDTEGNLIDSGIIGTFSEDGFTPMEDYEGSLPTGRRGRVMVLGD